MTAQVRDQEVVEEEEKKFDLRVHVRNPKTGQIVKVQPYRLIIRDGQQRYIRDGQEFYPNGDPVDPAAYLQREADKKVAPQQRSNAFAAEDSKRMNPLMEEMSKFKEEMVNDLKAFKENLFGVIKEEMLPLMASLKEEKAQLAKEKEAMKNVAPIRPPAAQGAKESK